MFQEWKQPICCWLHVKRTQSNGNASKKIEILFNIFNICLCNHNLGASFQIWFCRQNFQTSILFVSVSQNYLINVLTSSLWKKTRNNHMLIDKMFVQGKEKKIAIPFDVLKMAFVTLELNESTFISNLWSVSAYKVNVYGPISKRWKLFCMFMCIVHATNQSSFLREWARWLHCHWAKDALYLLSNNQAFTMQCAILPTV